MAASVNVSGVHIHFCGYSKNEIMKITRLELPTNNLAALKAFYATKLGLHMVSSSANSVAFDVGWTKLVLRQTEARSTPCHFALNVPLYTLEQYQLWFDVPYIDTRSTGERITNFPNWKARASYFYDPDGNVVEFIERTDAGYVESVGGYFQCISEIGLATDNVKVTTDWLLAQHNLPQFTKSSPQSDFNAVGDDYGLLILAQRGRSWLFTDVPAMSGDWTIEFCNRQGDLVELVAVR